MTQPYYQRVACSLVELDDNHWDKCFTKFNCPFYQLPHLYANSGIEYWISNTQ